MNGKVKIALLVTGLCCVALLGLGTAEYEQAIVTGAGGRVWHHELAAEADVTLGTTSIPDDFMVDGSFVSHLPLVIVDTFGQEIVNYKYYDPETYSFKVPEDVDPYVDMHISVIDNADFVNSLSDQPTYVSEGRIKVRGNSSASFTREKSQYLIKLSDEEGNKNYLSMMGMEPSDTWILNGTVIDRSYMRNYLALNTAGELDPFTPDIRMCEVVFKNGDQYEYMGLYGMYEKIEQGEGSVDIKPVSNPISISDRSYLLLRDRLDATSRYMEVWSTNNVSALDSVHHVGENWVNLEYPSASNITNEYWEYIQRDIYQIEEALYSDDPETFLQYRKLLDVDSFIDYCILNKFFLSYDAGWNSTFLYKNAKGTVSIGPVWDFDGAMDNFDDELAVLGVFPFVSSPWFDRLCRDEDFVVALIKRYNELRKTLLNDETIANKMSQTADFLEFPALRDMDRWAGKNHYVLADREDEETGLLVERQTEDFRSEVQRTQDVLQLHAEQMDNNWYNYLSLFFLPLETHMSLGGWLMIAAFFVSIILVQRHRKGM